MKTMNRFLPIQILAVACLMAPTMVGAQTSPRQETLKEIPNICPGEGGCTFGKWLVKDTVRIYRDRSVDSPVVATLKPKDTVTGISSVLAIIQYGACIANRDSLVHREQGGGERTMLAGEAIGVLYYEGEGYFLGKYCGDTVSVSTIESDLDCRNSESTLWLRLKLPSGKTGWTNERAKFTGTSRYDE